MPLRLLTPLSLAVAMHAPAAETETQDGDIEEIVVTADLDSLPAENRRSLFGFDKSILETPRSASTVSEAMMDRFNIRDIDELIALAPGSFTQSFFGVAGSLDIRGTTGETYFRGIRRLDNPGNYPTPIGASHRIDIVRGPASPIHGPAKIGGYLDFTPKSARIEATGEFIEERTAGISLDIGSWRQRVVGAELGGPGRLLGEDFGYWLYAEWEDSDSYYRDTSTDNALAQASFDLDMGSVQLQFGGMFHDFAGNENAGWNRLTQQLIDHGTYITGQPRPLDTDGDGRISHQEFDVDGDGATDLNPFAAGLLPGVTAPLTAGPFPGSCRIGTAIVFGCRPDLLALENPGTATLAGSQVLVAPEDGLRNDVTTLYFDVLGEIAQGWEWRNQMFYETYANRNEVAYGFSQDHRSTAFENKLVFSNILRGRSVTAAVQISPSLRRTSFELGGDYANEYFDRRDLTRPASALDRRRLATQIDADFTEYYIGKYLDLGLAALADVEWRTLSVLAGVRYDWIDLQSRQPLDKLLLPSSRYPCADGACVPTEASDAVDGVSWTLSASYAMPFGIRPYATFSRQATVVAGQGAEITVANIARGRAFDVSELREFGVKGSLRDDTLYFALAVYEQERTDFSAQNAVTNQASRTEGAEFELRWAASDRLLLTLGYSKIEVVNLNTLEAGRRFSFVGAEDVPGISPAALYGGALVGTIVQPGVAGARRAGVPEEIWSFTGTYDFGNGLAFTASAVDVDATPASFSKSVMLPAYTLINMGVVYKRSNWTFSATAKNLTDERYFRANFPNLFGGVIVLPELPRHYSGRIEVRW